MRAFLMMAAVGTLIAQTQFAQPQTPPQTCHSVANLIQPCTFDTGINSAGNKTYTIRGYQVVDHPANRPQNGVIPSPITGLDPEHVHVTVFIANSSGNGVEVKSAVADTSGRISYELSIPRGARVRKLGYIMSVATKEKHPLFSQNAELLAQFKKLETTVTTLQATVKPLDDERQKGIWLKACYIGEDTSAPLIFARNPMYNGKSSHHASESECAGGRGGTRTYLLACISFNTVLIGSNNKTNELFPNATGLRPSIIVAEQPYSK